MRKPVQFSPDRPQPILLDTDIGTDIDDVYALILAALSPEFDLRAVTVVNCDVNLRARLARRVLNLLGRNEVPVSVGAAVSLTPGERRGWIGHEGLGVTFPDETEPLAVSPEEADSMDAAQRIAACTLSAAQSGTPLTIFTIGGMTNLALAIRCYPEATRTIGQVIAMASTFHGFGEENARPEHNIACDSVAAEIVLRSGLPLTLVGLNVTQQTTMTATEVDALESIGGPLADALVGMHRIWFEVIGRDHSPMHDGLALALPLDPSLLTLVPAVATVPAHGPRVGHTIYHEPQGDEPACLVATSVDAPRFHTLLQSRIQQAVTRNRQD
jgi:purine nucleosidase